MGNFSSDVTDGRYNPGGELLVVRCGVARASRYIHQILISDPGFQDLKRTERMVAAFPEGTMETPADLQNRYVIF